MKKILLTSFSILLTICYLPVMALAQETSISEWIETTDSSTQQTEKIHESDRINHKPIFPESYDKSNQPPKFDSVMGKKLGYTPNTIRLKDMEFPFVDMRGNNGNGTDFDEMMTKLDENLVVQVGRNKMHAFFGHYYDLSGTGVFNAIVDYNLIDIGSEAIITNSLGYSKGYQFTQILEIINEEQAAHYYDDIPIAKLAYYGNGYDMLFLQYCRWDISLGLLMGNVAYRVW